MGVLNVTPDSFSDGGNFLKVENAVDHASTLIKQVRKLLIRLLLISL